MFLECARSSPTRRVLICKKQTPIQSLCADIYVDKSVFNHLSCGCSLGAFILSYSHAANRTLGSSINFVTTSATHSVNGNKIRCGAKKLGSSPNGPALDIGKALIRNGVLISCSGRYQPVATYRRSPMVQRTGPWIRYKEKEMRPRYWLKRNSKKAFSHQIRGIADTMKTAAQKR